ncbi:glycosyltransferase [Pseudalkalibacillus berkeleyi]|uniref:Glycosyltransferase n=1 Tax=Pseudalkalibacillus berkeleyi TaxID=1069813 RepID=A0ABS9GZC2_9BACL|nr:glycosyltransferase [Pseudalkalibacillus berkeleyi]MCF6136882.1 glycosyltransferase [Pseudalkalibacillus berkeleyi]
MISIITCTMRDSCMDNVFQNYTRQNYKQKELIIVLTKKDMDVKMWRQEASKYDGVKVFHIIDSWSLGKCLNFAVQQARYNWIANLEDDDYYATHYLTSSLREISRTKADVIGKTSVYLYMPVKKVLTIFNSNNEHQYVNDQKRVGAQYLQGGTLFFRRDINHSVPFRDQIVELDRLFCSDCLHEGYKVYSAGKENFVYIRNDTGTTHTWKVPNDLILNVSKVVAYTDDFIPYIEKRDVE